MNMMCLKNYIDQDTQVAGTHLSDFNTDVLMSLINTLISKSLTDAVFQVASHKFNLKNSYKDSSNYYNGRALCIMQGYDYRAQPATGKVLLNIGTLNSAFFQQITIDKFLEDTTFLEIEGEARVKRLGVFYS